jgi:hypothetical protein
MEGSLNDCAHGTGLFRSIRVFDLKSVTLPPPHEQQVRLRPRVGRPEICVPRFAMADNLLRSETLSRSAQVGMSAQLMQIMQPQQGVQYPAVANVDFLGFDRALADVFSCQWGRTPIMYSRPGCQGNYGRFSPRLQETWP